jgi:histidine triad (HIT) family protein
MSCIFCKIAAGEIPAQKVFENDNFIAFHDLFPKAPVHLLVIPKKHIESLAHLTAQDATLMGEMTLLLKDLATELHLKDGFKIAINTGKGGGQEVPHLHYHLTGTPKQD